MHRSTPPPRALPRRVRRLRLRCRGPDLDGPGRRHRDAPTLQAAIDAAVDGDIVRAMPGMYFECLDFRGRRSWSREAAPRSPCWTGWGGTPPW